MSRKFFPVFALLIVLSMVLAACAAPVAEEVAVAVEEAGETEGAAPAEGGSTLATVKERGYVICGGNANVPGFGFIDTEGNYSGFDIDFCKAVAAAVFGDAEKYEIRPLSSQERFTALQSGEIDTLIRNTTWTLSRDTDLGANFTATTFYDGQGFIVRIADGITALEDLDGGTVCVQTGTTTEANLADVMAARGISYEPIVYEDVETGWTTYEEGRCDAYTTDKSGLVSRRTLLGNPDDHMIMDETISKEPLGPVVRHGDDQWFDIVQWTVFATFFAEEHGITSANADDMMANTKSPSEKKFFGTEGELGSFLGLDADWAYNVVSQVGSYSEIYDRNLGPDTKTFIPRGLNSLYVDGGLLYAPAWR
ncbi:MAG: amino acid ABC transporter substrate-binding protein [Anaerolineae bacterium]|jgi:general L-amino acid transport system substrate-binding protein|nr:amino acid ABC transporter substrate-binding protein [Anaerolineae bacterium]MBT7783479.1 amino acid ABC transporter substrate-binding protein [Anaerolineae bacterium]